MFKTQNSASPGHDRLTTALRTVREECELSIATRTFIRSPVLWWLLQCLFTMRVTPFPSLGCDERHGNSCWLSRGACLRDRRCGNSEVRNQETERWIRGAVEQSGGIPGRATRA